MARTSLDSRNPKAAENDLSRESGESVFIIGFYSHSGGVRAAKGWGEEGKAMALTNAVDERYEFGLCTLYMTNM
jgi:erythromycin esterase-like protein